MRFSPYLHLFAFSVLSVLCCACSLSSTSPAPHSLALFPAPRELVKRISGRPLEWTQNGAAWDPALPHLNVAVNGTAAEFTPSGGVDMDGLAFATYTFEVTNYSGGGYVTPTFSGPADGAFIGVGDFEQNTWKWVEVDFNDPNATLQYDLSNVQMVSLDKGYVLVAVVTPSTSITLETLGIGQDQNSPPVAFITSVGRNEASPRRNWAGVGEAQYFSADNSYDPDGFVATMNVDFEGDGVYDKLLLPNVIDEPMDVSHAWESPGTYSVTLKATDNDGDISTYVHDVFVLGPPYDEAEPNNSFGTAQDVGAPPVAHHSFSFTTDGDAQDFFRFTQAAWGYVHIELHVGNVDSINSHPLVELYDAGQNLIASHAEEIVTQCPAGEYYVKCYDQDQAVPHDCELEISSAPNLPAADLSCDPADAAMPFRLHCEAFPADETGCDFNPQEINWLINGEPCLGSALVPCVNQREIDLYICTAGPIEVACEVKDLQGNVTTSSKSVTGQGSYHPSGPAAPSAVDWPLEPWNGSVYELPYRQFEISSQHNNRWLRISVPVKGTLTVWFKKTGSYSCYTKLYNHDLSVVEGMGGTFETGQTVRLQVHIEAGTHYLQFETNLGQFYPNAMGVQFTGAFLPDPDT